jgi:tmRNA-binding protein
MQKKRKTAFFHFSSIFFLKNSCALKANSRTKKRLFLQKRHFFVFFQKTDKKSLRILAHKLLKKAKK